MSSKSARKPAQQSTLSFSSKKITAAPSKQKSKVVEAVSSVKPSTPTTKYDASSKKQPARQKPVESDDSEEEVEVVDDFDDVEDVPVVIEVADVDVKSASEPEISELSNASDEDMQSASKGKSLAPKTMKELLTDPTFKTAYAEAKKNAGGDLTSSLKTERKAKTILRSFDLNYDYGPCAGITRMERWERAHRRGLNPPEVVKLILKTEKVEELSNEELESLRNSVFHGML